MPLAVKINVALRELNCQKIGSERVNVLQVNLECPEFLSIFVGVMSLFGLRILEIHNIPHFSPVFFDILSWNFSYNFV